MYGLCAVGGREGERERGREGERESVSHYTARHTAPPRASPLHLPYRREALINLFLSGPLLLPYRREAKMTPIASDITVTTQDSPA